MPATDPIADPSRSRTRSPGPGSYDRRGIVAALVLLALSFALASAATPLFRWLAQLLLQSAFVAAAWALVGGASSSTARQRLGWAPSRLPRRTQVIAILSCVAFVAAMSMWVLGPAPRPPERPFAPAWASNAALFLGLVVLPPICEELFFRGALQNLLTRQIGAAGAILLSSLLFASFHVAAGPDAMIFALLLGLGLGALTHQSGSVREAIGIHALNNAAYFASQFV